VEAEIKKEDLEEGGVEETNQEIKNRGEEEVGLKESAEADESGGISLTSSTHFQPNGEEEVKVSPQVKDEEEAMRPQRSRKKTLKDEEEAMRPQTAVEAHSKNRKPVILSKRGLPPPTPVSACTCTCKVYLLPHLSLHVHVPVILSKRGQKTNQRTLTKLFLSFFVFFYL